MGKPDTRGNARPSSPVGRRSVEDTPASTLDEHDLADEIHGSNRLQGQDQSRVHNQRLTQPGSLDAGNEPPETMLDEMDDADGSDRGAKPQSDGTGSGV